MLVTIPGSGGKDDATSHAVDVSCGSRHTVVLTKANLLWAFGWNKYGQVNTHGIFLGNESFVSTVMLNEYELLT